MGAPCLLAFDTSAAHCAAAVLCAGTVLAARVEDMTRGQAERLMGLVADTLSDAGVVLDDITTLAVGIGPGNFTGIRISVAAARGLALARNLPAHGISRLDAQAAGLTGPVLSLVGAPRGAVYAQRIGHGAEDTPRFLADPRHDLAALAAGGAIVADAAAMIPAREAGLTPLAPPLPLIEAIARLASARPRPTASPAPLYIRKADAAPPRHAPPPLLP